MRMWVTLASTFVSLTAVPARAQIEILEIGYGGDFEVMAIASQDGGVAAAPGQAAPKGPPSARQQKLQTLEYDRRPSAILAAWAKPPGSAASPEAPKTGAAESGASSEVAGAVKDDSGGAVVAPGAVVTSSGSTTLVRIGSSSAAAVPAAPVAPAATSPAAPPAPAQPSAAQPTPGQPAAEPTAEKAADDAAAKAAAEEAAKKAAEEAEKKKAEAKAIEDEMAALKRNVTLGAWDEVAKYLDGLTEDEHKAGYDKMLQSLVNGPQVRPPVPPQGQPYIEKNVFAPMDVAGIAAASRGEPSKEQIAHLGTLLRLALDSGHQIESFLEVVRPELDLPDAGFDRRRLALVLVAANEAIHLEGLLPSLEDAQAKNDREGLNLLSRYDLAQYAKDKKISWLEQAWTALQAVLAVGEVKDEVKDEAIQRCVEIAPKIREELGAKWLDESFTSRPERGMEILAAIGTATSTTIAKEPMDADKRLKLLELQKTAADALLAAAPQLADDWGAELGLLAANWMREALVTYQFDESGSMGPRMQRDFYGNFYYYDYGQSYRGNVPTPIRTDKLLATRPSDPWLARIETTLRPRFDMLFAQLHLKVGEEDTAFPYIERIAPVLPRQAKDLVAEFLRVWIKNHDPNSSQRTNQYVYFYGFEERSNSIPLTRSKQERNLAELAGWVARLKKLPVELDQKQLAQAFTTAHSSAEIYRLETIEGIFGSLAELEPETLAELVQRMRANLVTVWRDPAVQERNKTKRNAKDIEAEVIRGYELAHATLERARKDHPESWRLALASAAVLHDENDFRAEISKDSAFSSRREAAFEAFHEAARLYAAEVEGLEQEKESTELYETWFYAALGACDLRAVAAHHVLASREIPRIREALEALPGERAERHRATLASTMFARMSNAAPAVKYRYVKHGLELVGDHELAREARRVFDYYEDLVTEIQLVATVDGSDRVGHGEAFGLFVDLRHTREIERESGGFAKYLQNQNNQYFSYNYGRPTEDYRDKFETAAREALSEHFDVQSVTFQRPEVRSRAEPEYGWRRTPYCYVLLKPRGPQVDRVPPLRLDLDFLDTSGYAVLPVESPAIPIDASAEHGETRPYTKLALQQMLDERQYKDGKLLLEVKATAHGLAPDLGGVLDFAPEGFEIAKSEASAVSVTEFDADTGEIRSERTWTVTMHAKEGQAAIPTKFAFATPKVEATNENYRYVDADLATVPAVVDLERRYGEASRAWMVWTALVVVLVAGGLVALRARKRPELADAGRFRVPESVTPFTVLGLLRDIREHNGFAAEQHSELERQIQALELHYFSPAKGETPDLRRIAEHWAGRAS